MVVPREQIARLLVALPALAAFTACGASSGSRSSGAGARGGTAGSSAAIGGADAGARAGGAGQGGTGTAGSSAVAGGRSGSAASVGGSAVGGAAGATSGSGGVSSAGSGQGGDSSAGEAGSPLDAGAAGMDRDGGFEATQGTRDGIGQSPFCSGGIGCNGACVDFVDTVGNGGCSYVVDGFRINSIVANTANVFLAWGQTGFVPVSDTSKASPTELAVGDLYSTALALDSDYLYALGLSPFNGSSEWVTSVYRMPVAGGDAERLAYGGINPTDVAVDATHVYFAELQGGWALHRAPLAGGSTVDLAQSNQIRHVALSDDAVYFTEKDPPGLARILKADIPESLPKCPTGSPHCYTLPEPGMETGARTALDPTHVEVLDDSGAMFGLAIAGGAVYYANETAKTLMRLNPDGSRDLIMHGAVAHVLAIDGAHLYWIENETGFVMSLPLAGGPPRTVASVAPTTATGMTIAGKLIYVATTNGVIRALKP